MQLHPNTHKLLVTSSIGSDNTTSLVIETVTVYAYKTKTGETRLNFCGDDDEDPTDQKAIGFGTILYQKGVIAPLLFYEVKGRIILADHGAMRKFVTENNLIHKIFMGESIGRFILKKYRSYGENYGVPDNILVDLPVIEE